MASEWDGLWNLVREMGADKSAVVDITLPPPESITFNEGLAKGIDIQLGDLDSPDISGGLLSYKGSQVLVYIPDQGASLSTVLQNPESGKKFHVSHCSTLISMQSQNRNHRYVATNDTSGIFDLTNYHGTEKARGALTVCKNCLKHLNYQDYSGRFRERNNIFKNFSLIEFFSTYSSLFKYPYVQARDNVQRNINRAAESAAKWAPIDDERVCHSCGMSSTGNVVSSINNENEPPIFLCSDCHRRKNWQIAEPVLKDEMQRITRKRREQKLLADVGTWEEAFTLVDPAFIGLMKNYERQNYTVPEIGHPITDSDGVVQNIEIALAWEETRYGVVSNTEEKDFCERFGWNIRTLSEALIDSREDG